MTGQTITLRLPEDIYRRFQRAAQVSRTPLEDVMVRTIRGNLPPTVDDLPLDLQDKLAGLSDLSDEALWEIAREELQADQWQQHRRLLNKNEVGTLTDADRQDLDRLRTITDQFVLRRSYALALLEWRGYTLPIPVES